MQFDWREYLNLAQSLAQSTYCFNQEAAFRCATSRAYYAAFCYARNYARDKQDFSPTYKSEDHRLIRKHFKGKGMCKIVRFLENLRQWRNDCDYDDIVPNVSLLAKNAINEAQKLINILP